MVENFYAVNKEFFIIISLLFIGIYFYSKAAKHIIFSIIIAFFSKPEFLLLVITYFLSLKLSVNLRKYIIIAFIICISLLYNYIPNMENYTTVLLRGQTVDSLGFTILLHQLSVDYFLYFSVIAPRILINIYSAGFLYSSIYIILLLFIILRIKLTLSNDLLYFLSLFYIMVTVVPFPHFRYILPTYALLLFIAMRTKNYYR